MGRVGRGVGRDGKVTGWGKVVGQGGAELGKAGHVGDSSFFVSEVKRPK